MTAPMRLVPPRSPRAPRPQAEEDELDNLFRRYGSDRVTAAAPMPADTSAGKRLRRPKDATPVVQQAAAPQEDELDQLARQYGGASAATPPPVDTVAIATPPSSGDIDLRDEADRRTPQTGNQPIPAPRFDNVLTRTAGTRLPAVPAAPTQRLRLNPIAPPASAQAAEPTRPDGLLVPGNIDLTNRPQAKNPDGTISTGRSISVQIHGREVLIPTVSDDGRVLSDSAALDQYARTGKHLGVFNDAASANAYAQQLHEDQAKAIAKPSVATPEGMLGLEPASPSTPPTPAVATDAPRRLRRPVPPVAVDATRVGAEPSANYKPGTLERIATFPLAVAAGAVEHPIDFAMAPVNAAITATRGSAEQDAANAIAASGGDPSSVERTVSPKETAIASAQVAAALLAPELSRGASAAARPALRAALGDATTIAGRRAAATVIGHAAGAAPVGAAYTPNDPIVGVFGGMLLSLPTPAAADVASRAVQAGHDKIAGLVDAARQASENARTQGVADAHAEFNAMVARVLPTLTPKELAYLGTDPVLGPLSREALNAAGVARPEVPSVPPLSEAHAAPVPADVPVAEALRPRAAAPERAPSVDPGEELDRLAEQYGGAESRVASATPLTVAAPETHKFSSTQLDLPPKMGKAITDVAAKIPDADLAENGRETAPHVTVKYGLHDTDPEKIRELLKDEGPITVKLGKTSVFPNGESGEGDVVKADVDSPDLHALNKKIADALPHTDTHPDYKPHVTIAYVKPGLGEKYAGDESLVGYTATISELTFSSKDGTVTRIPLNDTRVETAREVAARGDSPMSTPDELGQLTERHAASPEAAHDIPHVPGRSTRVLLRDGQTLKAAYRVVSADDVRSSHDPFTFNPTAGYPEGVQGRDYQRNVSVQEAVARRSMEFNADLALNPSELASEGVPTILPNGTVLAGNERSMLARRTLVHAPERYRAYLEQLKARASEFGIEPSAIDHVESPMLVRVLTDPKDIAAGPKRLAEINRLSDEVATKAKSATEEGAARATKLAQATGSLEHLSSTLKPDQTVAEYLGTADGRAFVRSLKTDGVISADEFSRLTDAHGALTEDGRVAIRRMLLATAVTDPTAILDAPASVVSKLEHAVPSIVSTKGTTFDISPLATAALKMVAEAHDNGLSIDDLAGQGALFADRAHAPNVVALARFLDESKPSAVRSAFRRYASLAREALGNAESTDMFGGTGFNTPRDAFNDAFGIPSGIEADASGAEHGDQNGDAGRLFATLPTEQRGPAGHPTRAGELLAQSRANATTSPREGGAGPALGGLRKPSTPDVAVRGVNRFTDALRKIFAPASRGEEARITALTTREHDAALVHRYEQAKEALREFGRTMDRLPVREQLDFIDRLETGKDQRTPELTKAAATIRKQLDDARDAIRALGTGQLEHWIENYFPHIWADPARAKQVIASIMGKRSMTGPGSFLKKRSIPTVRDGIEAGLTPVTYNPIDLTLLKLREMHRYLAGQRIIGELKSNNLLRFVSSFAKRPAGYELINDKLSTVYGPPKVTVLEAYDHFIRQGLDEVMREMGVSHGRGANIGGGPGVLGYAKGDRLMATKSATPESVIEHELGHILDARLGLWRELHDYGGTEPKSKEAIAYRKKITLELRALADLRHEGIEDIPASQQAYERSRPEKIANAMMGLLHAPERMREVAPTVDARLREILARDPVTAKLLDIKPSFRHGANTFDVKTEGMVVLGHHYAPEPVARVLNNYLSPGLSESAIGPFFDVYRGAGNLLNMVQLGFSGFHLMFTSLDAIVSQNALGVLQGREALRALTHGDLSTAGRRAKEALTNVVTSPAAPITTAIKGARVGRAYYGGTDDPGLAQIIDGLEAGGGRAKMDEFYGGTAWRKFRLALHEGASTDLEPVARGKKLANAGAELLPATIEKSSAWLMQHVVPAQKRGVFFDLAQFELSKLPPGADRMQVRTAMARAWDSVENRMGQLTYNNLFWNRWLKDGLMASIRSVGWNVGTIREIGGGAIDVARSPLKSTSSLAHEAGQRFVLTPRASYFVSLPITVGLAGGLVHYLATGHVPSSLKDWYYPGTGQKNADGSDERGQLASYLRDMRDATTAPWQTVKNKLNPAVSLTLDMLNNKDFFGDKIRNEQDPLVQQLAQEARYILGQATPLGVRNLREGLARGQSLGTAAQSLVGITPAPRAVVRSEALNRMHDFLSARGGGVGLTPEQQGARRERTDLMGRLRQHEPDAGAAVGGAVSSGTISVDAAKRTLRTSAAPGAVAQFQRLTLPEALEVYRIATTEERQQFGSVLSDKLKRARPGQYSGKDLERIRNGIRALQPQR